MMRKQGLGSMTGAIVSILIVMALFYGAFDYVSVNYESANISEQIGYNQSKADLEISQRNLTKNVNDMKDAAIAVGEADGEAVTVAWNGLSGLAATIRTFFGIIGLAVDVWNAVLPGLGFLPIWTKLLIEIALIVWIILIIVGAFKGEAKT